MANSAFTLPPVIGDASKLTSFQTLTDGTAATYTKPDGIIIITEFS